MMYILAIILPPVALLMSGKIIQAIINLVLILLSVTIFVGTLSIGSFISFPLYIISIIHALFAVHGNRTDSKIEAAVDKAINDK
ncbi:MAG: YqaE/Pmp3 family membrane protein [Rhodospirillaceae bacterium]|jgi:uncharacterized membrane protein YqaE (UPF0057 family)|nr:YqaE/Pmp3 family membrane protein [Rhodospirillaceae bacterium]MBT7265584.1 YqaE/Pmp3 family membrane protein [Rhodospirillaceae bacterium]